MPRAAAIARRLVAKPDNGKLDGWFFRRAAVFEAVTGILAILAWLAWKGDRDTQRTLAENLPTLILWLVGTYLVGGTAHQVLMSKLPDATPPTPTQAQPPKEKPNA